MGCLIRRGRVSCYDRGMITFLAHAGKSHGTAIDATTHVLFQEWYIAVPILILSVLGLATIAFFLSKRSKAVTYLTVCGALLVIGVFSYTASPAVSIVALSGGMAMTLLIVLASLMPHNPKA